MADRQAKLNMIEELKKQARQRGIPEDQVQSAIIHVGESFWEDEKCGVMRTTEEFVAAVWRRLKS